MGGPHNRRYIPAPRCEVDDYPSCNLLIRKEAFDRAGRFNTEFWPGEDTVLCLKVVKDRKKKIIYDPGVLVYHHRRPLFGPHLRQIRSYALHRGYFVKRFPGTSLRGSYFLPSILVLAAALGAAASIVFPGFPGLYFLGALCYLSLVALSSFSAKGGG